MKAKKIINLLFLLFLIIGTVWIIRGKEKPVYHTAEGMIFGTTYKVVYEHTRPLDAEIRLRLDSIDASLSMFNSASMLARINRNDSVEADTFFIDVFNLAQRVASETGGAFDPTVAPLVNAWGFGFKQGTMPTASQIDSLRQLVGYDKISLRGKVVEKADTCMMLDFGAIAKGYGVDAVAARLETEGVKNFMVEIGGEIVARGRNAGGKRWRIGVSRPVEGSDATATANHQTVLAVSDMALATSGNYRNYYYKDGQKYAHTISPTTGHPVQHTLLSASVFAPTCAEADAYATAFMVMGADSARSFLASRPHLMAYLICAAPGDSVNVWHSPSLESLIVR